MASRITDFSSCPDLTAAVKSASRERREGRTTFLLRSGHTGYNPAVHGVGDAGPNPVRGISMLKETLTAAEKGRSPFEEAIRSLATPACSVFAKDGSIQPVSFAETETELATDDRSLRSHLT